MQEKIGGICETILRNDASRRAQNINWDPSLVVIKFDDPWWYHEIWRIEKIGHFEKKIGTYLVSNTCL